MNISDTLIFVGIIVGWIILNRFVLPKIGVQTWMSGACELDASHKEAQDKAIAEE